VLEEIIQTCPPCGYQSVKNNIVPGVKIYEHRECAYKMLNLPLISFGDTANISDGNKAGRLRQLYFISDTLKV